MRESERLAMAKWPLEGTEVAWGHSQVRQPTCEACSLREVWNGDERCLDKACFKAKEEGWFGYLVAILQERLEQDFGVTSVPISQSYGGDDLRRYDEVDVALTKEGVCAPGKCERLRLRYYAHGGDVYFGPYKNLPFVYNCNNAQSHKACQRRFLNARQSQDEVEAEKLAKKSAEGRKKIGKELVARAELSVSRALRDSRPAVWRALAEELGCKLKNKAQGRDDSARQIAAALVDGADRMRWIQWGSDEAEQQFAELLAKHMERLGVRMLPGPEELAGQLERLSNFIVDVNRGEVEIDAGVIAGNRENLLEMHRLLIEMREDGRITDHGQFVEMCERHDQLREQWEVISREMVAQF